MVYSPEFVLTPQSAKAMLRVIGLETGSPIHDDDLAQEALLRGLIAFGRCRHVSNPQAFFAKIVRDTVYDSWRRRRTLQSLHLLSAAELSDTCSLDVHIDRKRRLHRIYEALDSLSETEYHLIHLFYFQEMSVAEISEAFGTSRSAVKMRLLRTRKKIVELVAEQSAPVD